MSSWWAEGPVDLQAARMGAKVVLAECFDMPGGVHTSELQGSADVGVGGIHTELMQRFAAEGYIYTATENTHAYVANLGSGIAFSHMGSCFNRRAY
jgi:hypothetical protein